MKMGLYNITLIVGVSIFAVCLSGYIALGLELGEVHPSSQYVDINNGSFTPSRIIVPMNTTVIWSNHNNSTETVTAADGSFDSGNISKNDYEYRHIFLKTGRYEYYSEVHPSMRGSIIVTVLGDVNVTWSPEAESMLARIPEFARGMAKKAIESYAIENRIDEITPKIVSDVGKRYGMGK